MQENINFNKDNDKTFDALIKKREDLYQELKATLSEKELISRHYEENDIENNSTRESIDHKILDHKKQIEEIENEILEYLKERKPQTTDLGEKLKEQKFFKEKISQLTKDIQEIEEKLASENNAERQSTSEEERFRKIELCSTYQALLNSLTKEIGEVNDN